MELCGSQTSNYKRFVKHIHNAINSERNYDVVISSALTSLRSCYKHMILIEHMPKLTTDTNCDVNVLKYHGFQWVFIFILIYYISLVC